MSSRAHEVLSTRVLRVDSGAPLSDTLAEIRHKRASHVAVFSQMECLGVSSFNDADAASGETTVKDLLQRQPCPSVSDTTSLEELGRLFADPRIDAQIVHNDQGDFVGVVTRQSLLEGLLKERAQTEASLSPSNVIEPTQAESLLAGERQVLEIVSTSNSQDGGLTELVEFIEAQSEGMICSILLLDADGARLRTGASISLPDDYNRSIDGMRIGPNAGSCGTAAFLNQPVIVSDIGSDPLWTDFRDLGLKHGLHACWSIPIRSSSGNVLGTFAMYYHEPRSPDAYHQNLIDRAALLATIAIDRKNANSAIVEGNLRFRAIFESVPECVKLLDADGILLDMNAAGLELIGADSLDQVRGESIYSLIAPEYLDEFVANGQAVLQGESNTQEFEIIGLRGARRRMRTHQVPFADQGGKVASVLAVTRDVSEQVRAEEQIQVKNSVLEGITQLQREFLADVDPSQSFGQMLAFLIEVTASEYGFIGEVLHRPGGKPCLKTCAITNIAWDDDTRAFYEQNAPSGLEFDNLNTLFGAVLTTGETVVANDAANDLRAGGVPSGHPPLDTFLGLPLFHAGEMVGMCGLANREGGYDERIIKTLTPILATCASFVHAHELDRQRRQAETSLRDSEARSRTLLEGSPVCIKFVDLDSRLQYMSRAGQEQLKICDIEPFYGSDFPPELYPECWRAPVADHLERAKAGETSSLECPVLDTEGNEVWFDTTFVPARDEDGIVQHIIVTSVNITERNQAEWERERLIAELESKNAELERFVYTVSHDLKSPLLTISGFLGVLKRDVAAGDAEAAEKDVTFISDAAHKMEHLLNDLLQISRVGRQNNSPEEIALTDLAQDVVSMASGRIDERGIQTEISPDLPVVFGDRLRLWEVFQNLVDNAAKFMGDQPQPRIEIGCRRDGDEATCYVRDNGIGIDPAYHEKIFDLFDRLNPEYEGTGVGLAIVKRIVEVHGGRVWVESEGTGRGSTFCLTVPRRREETSDERNSRAVS